MARVQVVAYLRGPDRAHDECFQSPGAISRQMPEEGYGYWLLLHNGTEGRPQVMKGCERARVAGLTRSFDELETGNFVISKICLSRRCEVIISCARPSSSMMLCYARGLCAMYLTVNKHNDLGVRAYRGTGFATIGCVKIDIGRGCIMDERILKRPVEPGQLLPASLRTVLALPNVPRGTFHLCGTCTRASCPRPLAKAILEARGSV